MEFDKDNIFVTKAGNTTVCIRVMVRHVRDCVPIWFFILYNIYQRWNILNTFLREYNQITTHLKINYRIFSTQLPNNNVKNPLSFHIKCLWLLVIIQSSHKNDHFSFCQEITQCQHELRTNWSITRHQNSVLYLVKSKSAFP